MKTTFTMLAAAAAAILIAAPAHATTTYTYTAPWTGWMDSTGLNRALYAGLDGSGIRFEFTTAAPLTSFGCQTTNCDPSSALSQVTSWSYHGGGPSLNLSSDTVGALTGLNLSTDASGAVINEYVTRFYVNGPIVLPGLEAYHSTLTEAHSFYDQQLVTSDFPRFYQCPGWPYACMYPTLAEGMSNMAGWGSWAMATTNTPITSAVPEPETYAMLLAGLGLLGFAARRRRATHFR